MMWGRALTVGQWGRGECRARPAQQIVTGATIRDLRSPRRFGLLCRFRAAWATRFRERQEGSDARVKLMPQRIIG